MCIFSYAAFHMDNLCGTPVSLSVHGAQALFKPAASQLRQWSQQGWKPTRSKSLRTAVHAGLFCEAILPLTSLLSLLGGTDGTSEQFPIFIGKYLQRFAVS